MVQQWQELNCATLEQCETNRTINKAKSFGAFVLCAMPRMAGKGIFVFHPGNVKKRCYGGKPLLLQERLLFTSAKDGTKNSFL
ncbi:hypothetical protein CEXT_781711 [Caerostris extrusa]|uniref:Uncharacterized protein n=1 Tax=Caerostris extrusa TaxID=172846 RepID=A0AAV4XFH4_CAEEX|nr:hypothetical protein CEXT_781711 [Caerostris extrusa]